MEQESVLLQKHSLPLGVVMKSLSIPSSKLTAWLPLVLTYLSTRIKVEGRSGAPTEQQLNRYTTLSTLLLVSHNLLTTVTVSTGPTNS